MILGYELWSFAAAHTGHDGCARAARQPLIGFLRQRGAVFLSRESKPRVVAALADSDRALPVRRAARPLPRSRRNAPRAGRRAHHREHGKLAQIMRVSVGAISATVRCSGGSNVLQV
jgi:hypothetical protein